MSAPTVDRERASCDIRIETYLTWLGKQAEKSIFPHLRDSWRAYGSFCETGYQFFRRAAWRAIQEAAAELERAEKRRRAA
jgi:hypothetical protein